RSWDDRSSVGVVVGQPVRAEEHGAGSIGIFVHAHLRLDEVWAQPAFGQLQALAVPGDGVVGGDRPLLDDAEDLAPRLVRIRYEGRAFLLGRNSEAGVVLSDVMALQPGVGRI